MMEKTAGRPTIQDRTRAAIISAAASTWARNRAASLGDIAEIAGVGRSTVHRYFPNRKQLIDATVVACAEEVERAVAEARPDHGSPEDALRRVVAALVEAGDQIIFLFDDADTIQRLNALGYIETTNNPVVELIGRGQGEGVFDDTVPAEWIQNVIWAMVYTGIEKAEDGLLLRHDVAPTIMRTLLHGVIGPARTS